PQAIRLMEIVVSAAPLGSNYKPAVMIPHPIGPGWFVADVSPDHHGAKRALIERPGAIYGHHVVHSAIDKLAEHQVLPPGKSHVAHAAFSRNLTTCTFFLGADLPARTFIRRAISRLRSSAVMRLQ